MFSIQHKTCQHASGHPPLARNLPKKNLNRHSIPLLQGEARHVVDKERVEPFVSPGDLNAGIRQALHTDPQHPDSLTWSGVEWSGE